MDRLSSLSAALSCLGLAIVRGRATSVPSPLRRLAIVQRAKLGDMVCTTPVFRAVKRAHADVSVTVVGNTINREILGEHPAVDAYLVWQPSIWTMARILRHNRFDALCMTAPSAEVLFAAYLAGIPCIVAPVVTHGFSSIETRLYRWMRWLAITVPHRMGAYAPREYLRLLEPLGIETDDTTKQLTFTAAAHDTIAAFLREHKLERPFAALSPSAGNKIKNWPADRFARVAEHIASRGMPVVVVGGSRDTEEVAAMMHAVVKPEGIVDASGLFSVDELKALIARAALFVSCDTGPLYIAEAFGVATVDIVGPMDENEQPPRGPRHRVVVAERDAPVLHIMNARIYDAREARRQVEAITVAMVLAEVEPFIPSAVSSTR